MGFPKCAAVPEPGDGAFCSTLQQMEAEFSSAVPIAVCLKEEGVELIVNRVEGGVNLSLFLVISC